MARGVSVELRGRGRRVVRRIGGWNVLELAVLTR